MFFRNVKTRPSVSRQIAQLVPVSKGSIRLLLESSPSDTFPMHVWRNKMCVDTTQAAPPLPLNSYVPFLLLHKLLPAPPVL